MVAAGTFFLCASAETLTWDGGNAGAWDMTAENWKTEGGTATAWIEGSTIVVPNGQIVNATTAFTVAGATLGAGSAIGGEGALILSGDVAVASGAASLSLPVWTGNACAKTGTGDLAANQLAGAMTVSGGHLLTGSFHGVRAAAVENGGTHVVMAADAAAENLIVNGSFEESATAMSSAGYMYVKGTQMPTSWVNPSSSLFVWLNKWGGTPWNGSDKILDEAYMVGFQRNGSASQTVTVPADGFYELTYLTCKRSISNSQRNHFLEVTVDGVRRFSQLSVWMLQNPYSMGTGPIWLSAGAHEIGFKGEQRWEDATTFIDNVQLRACAPTTAPAADEVVVTDGVIDAPTLVADANGVSYLTKTGAGTGMIADSLTLPGSFCQISVNGRLEFTGRVSGTTANPYLVKRGPGTAAFTGGLSTLGLWLTEGTLEIDNASNFGLQIRTLKGTPATFVMDTKENRNVSFTALGTGAVTIRTTGGAHTLAVASGQSCALAVPEITFDVGAGDLVQLPYLYEIAMNSESFVTDLVKAGPGRLQLTAATPTNVGGTGLAGGTTLREGTLEVMVDDLAANAVHPLTGGPNLYSPVLGAISRPLLLGDAATPADAVLTLKPLKADFASARVVNVGAEGASVAIDASALNGSACFGSVVLGRAETEAKGPATGFLALGQVSKASGFAAPAKLVATGTVLVERCEDAGVEIASSGELGFGRTATSPVTVGALELSGVYALSFVNGTSPTVHAGALRLGATTLKLVDRLSDEVPALVGTRTLFTYDTLEGDPEQLLALDDGSRIAGYSYSLAHDATAKTITLTISGAEGNPNYTWMTSDGDWDAGTSWDHGAVPNAADVYAVLGSVPTAPTTVTLDGTKTVGGLTFANTQGFTLTGGALALAPQDEVRPVVKVFYGTHTIASDLGTTDDGAITVEVAPGATLVIGGAVNAPLDVISGTVEFGPNAQINARVTTTSDATMNVNANLTLDGATTLAGALTGTGRLTKTGAGELALPTSVDAARPFGGTIAVEQGSLRLGVPALDAATIDLGAETSLTVDTDAHGLMGTFRRTGKTSTTEMNEFCAATYGLETFQNKFNGLGLITNVFFGASTSNIFHVVDTDAGNPTLPTACRQGGPNQDYWLAVWEGFLTVPESGVYEFSCKPDDAMVLAIDRRSVMQITNCLAVVGSVYLEKGPHAIYIGLVEISGNMRLPLNVKRPGATAVEGLPIAWLSPAVAAKRTVGAGALAPADGSVLTVRQGSGVSTAFTGPLAGAGTGALVLQPQPNGAKGQFELSDWTGGIPYLQDGELAVVAPGRTLEAIGSEYNNGTLSLIGAAGVKSVYGSSITSLGAHLWARAITSDDNCGISTNKTYTHLVSFPLTGNTNPTPVVNGVTFDGRGAFTTGGTAPSMFMNDSMKFTGFKSLFNSFSYGSTDYSFTLTGLTPGRVYDYRFYWMVWGLSQSGNGHRYGTFTFSGQDADGASCVYQSYKVDLDTAFGTTSKGSFAIVGCRYVAGPDGTMTVRIQSDTSNDTVHCYAFSNELLGSGTSDGDRMTIAPDAGTRATLQARLNGTADVTVGGEGEQRLAGEVKMTKPLKVTGHLTLVGGADVQSGVALAGGTLELRGGAKLGALSGSGTLDLRWGDPRPFGALRDDGNFDALTGFRVTNFTGDDDCGITPSKNYLLAMNYRENASNTAFDYVNEVPFKQSSPGKQNPTPGEMYDFYDSRARVGATLVGVPWNPHAGGNADGIKLSASEGMYNVLYAMTYANGQKDKDLPIKIGGLTAGRTYELRFWERMWESGKAEVRNVEFTFRPDGAEADETHMVKIDGAGKDYPYYIAFRFTATSSGYTVTSKSLASDTWHLYGATIEQVEPGVTDRAVLDLAADSAVAGVVTGVGMVEKRGAGTLTLEGNGVNAKGFWYVRNGGLRLTDAAATLGSVAVGAEGTFGGRGSVTGDLGVSAGGTLVLDGILQVGGKLAIGEGAKVVVTGKPSCAAGTLVLPSALTIKPTEKLTGRTTLFAGAADLTGIDLSGWTICKPGEETVDRAAKVALAPDAKSVLLVPNAGTVLLIR